MTPETSAIPSGDTERIERERLIATLDDQGNEIAGEGHMGWGNTMHEAADMLRADANLRTRLRESEDEARRLREDAERYRWLRSNWQRAGQFLNPDDLNACVDWHLAASAQTGEGK